jgi:hypothetical protein
MKNLSHLQKVFRCFGFCLICLFALKAQAQKADKIYQMNGTIISVKVMSTEGDSVFYRPYIVSTLKVVFSLPKTAIDKIIYPNDDIELYGGKIVNYPQRDRKKRPDIIYKKDGSALSVIIVSTTADSVHYRAAFKNADRTIFSMPKSEVFRIDYKNGPMEYVSEMSDENIRISNEYTRTNVEKKKRSRDSIQAHLNRQKDIIKFTTFTPIKNYLVLGYERHIRKQQSAEVKVGFIGVNQEEYELPASGAFGSISYKFIIKPDEIPKKPRSPLHGLYFRPEFAFGSYDHIYTHETYRGSNSRPEIETSKHHVSYQCFVLNFGKQWISNGVVIDLFTGLGIGSYSQSASSFGIVWATRFGYRMNMPAIKGTENVKFKLGFYIGLNFK